MWWSLKGKKGPHTLIRSHSEKSSCLTNLEESYIILSFRVVETYSSKIIDFIGNLAPLGYLEKGFSSIFYWHFELSSAILCFFFFFFLNYNKTFVRQIRASSIYIYIYIYILSKMILQITNCVTNKRTQNCLNNQKLQPKNIKTSYPPSISHSSHRNLRILSRDWV